MRAGDYVAVGKLIRFIVTEDISKKQEGQGHLQIEQTWFLTNRKKLTKMTWVT